MKRLLNMIDATKELNILRALKGHKSPFKVVGSYRLIDDGFLPEATVIIKTENGEMHEAATGKGPVDALANVLTKSLSSLFPVIGGIKLVDFASRIHDSKAGTAAKVEVNIVFTDSDTIWSVTAIAQNINKASFMALLDGFEYAILSREIARGPGKRR